MTKRTHTHRGTCQACGAAQAVDNTTGLVAKHGYHVAGFGFFNGVCRGAGHKPAEVEVFLTYRIIESCLEWAVEADRLADLWSNGTLMVHMHERTNYRSTTNRYGARTTHNIMMFGCTDHAIDYQRGVEVRHQQMQAERARSHADSLKRHVLPRLGMPLYPADVKVVLQFQAGQVVKGYDGAMVKLTSAVYGMGFGGQNRVRGWRFTLADGTPAKGWLSMHDLRKYNAVAS
jgi:hypothetical protein